MNPDSGDRATDHAFSSGGDSRGESPPLVPRTTPDELIFSPRAVAQARLADADVLYLYYPLAGERFAGSFDLAAVKVFIVWAAAIA